MKYKIEMVERKGIVYEVYKKTWYGWKFKYSSYSLFEAERWIKLDAIPAKHFDDKGDQIDRT